MRAASPNEFARRPRDATRRSEFWTAENLRGSFDYARQSSPLWGSFYQSLINTLRIAFFSSNVVKNLRINRQLSSCSPPSSLDSSLTFVNLLETILWPGFAPIVYCTVLSRRVI